MTRLLTRLPVESPPQTPQWEAFHRRWLRLVPPLRPNAEVCGRMRGLVADGYGRVLVLGATPELATIADSTVAVDWSASALAHIWPGRAPGREAIRADWLHLPCADQSFVAAIGDGSLNCLEFPSGYRRLFDTLARVVRPGGCIVIRAFVAPETGESMTRTRADAMAGGVQTVGALKWRMAHLVAAEQRDPNVTAPSIADAFNRCFPDRAALSRAAGWSRKDLEEIDGLVGVRGGYSFPTSTQLLDVVPASLGQLALRPSGTYELADRCPLLAAEVRS
ncbi:MAG TPA: class I SAM-dependent methyltransferase [Vicinamibacterales bacterium]|nr:class I SAM-dependent methyltransferase [Vicinamibacterales bacterium]